MTECDRSIATSMRKPAWLYSGGGRNPMREWMSQHGWLMLAISLGTLVVSLAGGILVIIKMPADHFVRPQEHSAHPVMRVLKNVAGVLLLILGIVMSLPLVPGPGLVFLAVGVSLTSFPGKKRFERMTLRRGWVMGAINWIRAKAR